MSTEQNLKMSTTKIFDIKGTALLKAMASERMSLTCAPGGENHAGMEIIGRMPVKGEGFTARDIEGLGTDTAIDVSGINFITVTDSNPANKDSNADRINRLTNGVRGQIVTLLFEARIRVLNNDNPEINEMNLKGDSNESFGEGDTLQVIFNGTSWNELSRGDN